MSPTRSRYRDLGLELVYLKDNNSHHPKWPPMVEENRGNEERDPIKMLLDEESLAQQRKKMMYNFTQIL